MKCERYKWQSECLTAWEHSHFRGIVSAVTGAGKTRLALEAIGLLREKRPHLRVKIVVPTIPLAQQWQTALLHAAETEAERPGFYGGGRHDDPDRPVMIYILNSARETLSAHMRREFALGHPCLLICDECHHCQSPGNRHIFDFLTPEVEDGDLYASLGLSATAFGTEFDEILIRNLGRECFRYDLETAAAERVIVPFLICEVSIPFLQEEKEQYGVLTESLSKATKKLLRAYPQLKGQEGTTFLRQVSRLAHRAHMDPEDPAAAYLLIAYQRKQYCNQAYGRIRCTLKLVEGLKPEDRILVFCERTEQAEQLARMIRRRWGTVCGIYHSGMTKEARERNLREFSEHRLRILVSCRCLDEGIDVPDANIGIVLSGTSTERQRLQRLGRLLRNSPGKDAARLYYLYVRDAAEDKAYLAGSSDSKEFQLHYMLPDDDLSNALYEYAAQSLLSKYRELGSAQEQIRELRACLMEGLPRGDYLLSIQMLENHRKRAASRHSRNYWVAMQGIHRSFIEDEAETEMP